MLNQVNLPDKESNEYESDQPLPKGKALNLRPSGQPYLAQPYHTSDQCRTNRLWVLRMNKAIIQIMFKCSILCELFIQRNRICSLLILLHEIDKDARTCSTLLDEKCS